jgi:hypothetical protein
MPFPDNTPGIDALINLPVGEIAQLPVELLAAMQREIDAAATQMRPLRQPQEDQPTWNAPKS